MTRPNRKRRSGRQPEPPVTSRQRSGRQPEPLISAKPTAWMRPRPSGEKTPSRKDLPVARLDRAPGDCEEHGRFPLTVRPLDLRFALAAVIGVAYLFEPQVLVALLLAGFVYRSFGAGDQVL